MDGTFDISFCRISHCNSLKIRLKNSCDVGFYDIHKPCIPNRVKFRGKIKTKVLITSDHIRYLRISLGGGMSAYFPFSGLDLWVQV